MLCAAFLALGPTGKWPDGTLVISVIAPTATPLRQNMVTFSLSVNSFTTYFTICGYTQNPSVALRTTKTDFWVFFGAGMWLQGEQGQPKAGERSLGGNFSIPVGNLIYLWHMEEKTEVEGLVLKCKNTVNPVTAFRLKMGRWGRNFQGVILGNTL